MVICLQQLEFKPIVPYVRSNYKMLREQKCMNEGQVDSTCSFMFQADMKKIRNRQTQMQVVRKRQYGKTNKNDK